MFQTVPVLNYHFSNIPCSELPFFRLFFKNLFSFRFLPFRFAFVQNYLFRLVRCQTYPFPIWYLSHCVSELPLFSFFLLNLGIVQLVPVHKYRFPNVCFSDLLFFQMVPIHTCIVFNFPISELSYSRVPFP